jgi:hypothetical protein
MSDADDLDLVGRELLRDTRTLPLRRRMEAFVEEHTADDPKRLRKTAASGADLSEIVEEGRNERV